MPAPTQLIRTAVIGYGFGGKIFHCPFITAVPGLELTAIVQRTGNTAGESYPQAKLLKTPEEAFADPHLDLIVITTHNDSHVPLAEAALRAGKHVVVDKPLAPTSAEARALITLATEQNRILAPFHNRRYDNDFLTFRDLIAKDTLGRIVEVNSHFDRFRPTLRAGSWKELPGPASGVLFDLGPHLVDQALAHFGRPARLTASVRHERDITEIDDAFTVTLEYDQPSGHLLRYICHATTLAANTPPRLTVHGTGGSYTKPGLDPQEAALLAGARPPAQPEPWTFETIPGTLALPDSNGSTQREPVPNLPGDYRLFYANVRDAISGIAPLAIPAEDACRTIRLLELALQSSQERRTLDVTF